MNQSYQHQEEVLSEQKRYEKENYISIQDYTGEGYRLYDHNDAILDIAENHVDRIVEAIEYFFQNTYGIHVKIHNMVSGNSGVTVFVESVREPYFHTFVVVPIDEKQKNVKVRYIWSQDGEVERAIKGGLYVMAFDKGFNKLDKYLNDVTNDFPIVGTPQKVIDNVKANGYMTPFYFISPFGKVFQKLFDAYMSQSTFNKTDVRHFFEENLPDTRHINIGIEYYMKEKGAFPDKDILDTIASDLKEMSGIPKGTYSIFLNDNLVDKKRGTGKKYNTLEKSKLLKHG